MINRKISPPESSRAGAAPPGDAGFLIVASSRLGPLIVGNVSPAAAAVAKSMPPPALGFQGVGDRR